MTGKVEVMRADKGFVFARTSAGESYFVHCSEFADFNGRSATFDGLQLGDHVTFEHQESPRGLRAIRVNVVAA
jgi:cold shock CspA family protein